MLGQVLTRDSLALAAFYDDTFGSDWINNSGWLQSPVGQWYGVGLDPGGQVISLKLPNNGLKGSIGGSIKDLVSLHVLDVSNNEIEGIPEVFNEMEISAVDVGNNKLKDLANYSGITRTFALFVNNNQLDFSDLEINASLPGLVYNPQQALGEPQVETVNLGTSTSFQITTGGDFNDYQWYLNGQPIAGAIGTTWQIAGARFEDLGDYHCLINNQLLPNLTLTSAPYSLQVETTIQGTVQSGGSVLVEAVLEFYRFKGTTYQLESTIIADQGDWLDDHFNMGTYLIRVLPLNGNFLPFYVGSNQLFWEESEVNVINGDHPEFNEVIDPIDTPNGSSSVSAQLLNTPPTFENATIFLFEVIDNKETPIAFTKPDVNATFEFANLPAGNYKLDIDCPGVTRGAPTFFSLSSETLLSVDVEMTGGVSSSTGSHSVARLWNEVLLEAIRKDFARPTVHARNLFHLSAAMYDAWALFDDQATSYLIGNSLHDYSSFIEPFPKTEDLTSSRKEAISYAALRLLSHRFDSSPDAQATLARFHSLFLSLGYDPDFTSTDYTLGNPAALGNFIAKTYIEYGLLDGSNESNDYRNKYYQPKNEPLVPAFPGNPNLDQYNHWQPLTLDIFIDQSGHIIPRNTPEFLSPEWGQVAPFSLKEQDASNHRVDGFDYRVYKDPGAPPHIDLQGAGSTEEAYKWGFSLVSVWSSHMDPGDGVLWDISPASLGNSTSFPESFAQYPEFYKLLPGGGTSQGHDLNPATNLPYTPQIVPRGDYTRVLAEFWADGPDSETPPGHWFTLLNYVNDHPLFEKKFKGQGPRVDPLEWDIKAYFMLGGAMHDAAISAWGIKGYYDYLRPISAIRGMAGFGQSSDPQGLSYHPDGIPLIEGYIETIEATDPLVGNQQENLGKIKLKAWRGPDYIVNPDNFAAEVGWILAENWWPYQRPSFVTPPFAGYISGHSTFSRAAAEILTLLTGDAYFPGGLGEFKAKKDEFLVFEEGPSMDIILQWATYRDASDETSLSRIWGGIHPPADDLPGRLIGEAIGIEAFDFASGYFDGSAEITPTRNIDIPVSVFPVPATDRLTLQFKDPGQTIEISIMNIQGQIIRSEKIQFLSFERFYTMALSNFPDGFYLLQIQGSGWETSLKVIVRK